MIEQFQIFADFHALFARRHTNSDFAKGAGKRGRDRFAAQALERRDSLLPKQNERVSVNRRGDVNNIRAGQIRRDGGGAALINVYGSRNNALNRDCP
jgi:hypothetical protein